MNRKVPSRKTLVRNADQVFSKYIRARDGRCIVCGSQKHLQCGHYYSRARYATRWLEDNAFAQCASCNILHELNPEPMREKVVARIGEKRLLEVGRLWNTVTKLRNYELKEIAQKYKTKLKSLEERY